jgi:hypothetical protein
MGPLHPDSNMDQARNLQHLQSTTTTSTNNRSPNTMPPRRSRRPAAAIARPDGQGLHPESTVRRSIVPHHDAPSREVNAQRSPPSCPPSSVKAFAQLHHTQHPLMSMVVARRLHNTATRRGLALPEAPPWRLNKHHQPPGPAPIGRRGAEKRGTPSRRGEGRAS